MYINIYTRHSITIWVHVYKYFHQDYVTHSWDWFACQNQVKSILWERTPLVATRQCFWYAYIAHHWPKELLIWQRTVNYDYIITNSINCLLIVSRCISNGVHTNHCWANLAHISKRLKNSYMRLLPLPHLFLLTDIHGY